MDKSNKKDRQYVTSEELKKLKIHFSNSMYHTSQLYKHLVNVVIHYNVIIT